MSLWLILSDLDRLVAGAWRWRASVGGDPCHRGLLIPTSGGASFITTGVHGCYSPTSDRGAPRGPHGQALEAKATAARRTISTAATLCSNGASNPGGRTARHHQHGGNPVYQPGGNPVQQRTISTAASAPSLPQVRSYLLAPPLSVDPPSLALFIVADSGENWSVGQRQLLCLGRVILKQTQILFMDQATASVDSQTDATIQKITRQEFSSCTIISIAHRIPTVMDCDRVLVLDAGRFLQSCCLYIRYSFILRGVCWYLVKFVFQNVILKYYRFLFRSGKRI